MRALAVLGVILFHIRESLLPGGFVGVDVFFVISGFLITGKILIDQDQGRFTFAEFYRARVKRIAPMLFVTCVVALIVSQIWFLPEDSIAAAKSVVASVLSISNVYFWRSKSAEYFAPDSAQIPLLHLWSLSVEEQFYVAWPVALMLLSRRRNSMLAQLVTLATVVASFAFAQWYYHVDASFTYYLLPARAGELLVGAIAAHIAISRSVAVPLKAWAECMAILGIVGILGSYFLLSEKTVFPGVSAIPGTVGTALLLLANHGRNTFLGRALSIRPIVFIGQISYSAYLWHWLLLAVYRYAYGAVRISDAPWLLTTIIAVSAASFFAIERPARQYSRSATRTLVVQGLIPLVLITSVALPLARADRWGINVHGRTYVESLARLRRNTEAAFFRPEVCQRQRVSDADLRLPACFINDGPVTRVDSAILWGDSNASQFIAMLKVFSGHGGIAFRNIEIGSCPPVFDHLRESSAPERARDCEASMPVVRAHLGQYHTVVLGASWTDYAARSALFIPAVRATVEQLIADGHRVVVIGKAPEWAGFDRRCEEKALLITNKRCTPIEIRVPANVSRVNQQLATLASELPGAEFYDPLPSLCPRTVCSSHLPNGMSRLYDFAHLSAAGSQSLGEQILAAGGVPAAFRR